MKAIPAALAALTLIAMPVLAGCTATTTPATSPASASPSTSAVAFNDADGVQSRRSLAYQPTSDGP